MQEAYAYEEILQELFSLRASQHVRPDLGPMQEAVALFSHPEKELAFIHITGTNGKGSTAAFITEILLCAGKKVGTYTSPFLTDYRERITVNRTFIPKSDVVRLYKNIQERTHANNIELSFFEISTLMAVLYFKEQEVDFVVWEVGMGGSFDATKIANAKTSCITNVALDHTDVLGKTKEQIAKDKCGIITKHAHVFSAEEDPAIQAIIKKVSREKEAELHFTKPTSKDIILGLKGEHQRKNAGLAIAITQDLNIADAYIKKGLAQTQWAGRLDYIEHNVLLDCAHNPAGMQSLRDYLLTEKEQHTYEKLYIIFGASKDKDITNMIRLLPEHEELIFTQAHYFRAQAVDEVSFTCTKIAKSSEALSYAKAKASDKDLILICGSIFLIGEILQGYQKQRLEVCPWYC